MKHPIDEYNDALKRIKDLEREHSNAKIDGYYKGSGGRPGPISWLIKTIGWLIFWISILGVIATAVLYATGNWDVLKQLLQTAP